MREVCDTICVDESFLERKGKRKRDSAQCFGSGFMREIEGPWER